VSRWLRIADVTPDPEPVAQPEPLHLPRPEDPFTRRSRRLAGAVSAAVHVVLVLVVLLFPELVPESLRRAARPKPVEQVEKLPVTFQEFRPAPPPPPPPTARQGRQATRGQPAPRAPVPPPAPDNREAGAAGPRAPQGPDRGQLPPPGGSVLPPEEGPAARAAPSPQSGNRPFDLNRALEDFRRTVPPPDPRQGAGAGAAPSGSGAGHGVPSLPSTGFSAGNLEFESRDYDWTDYYRQIHYAIWQAWHRRLYQSTELFERYAQARGDWLLENAARIRFTILRSGQVVDVSVEERSGCPPLDASAADALREVVLPPLPADFPRGSETVHGRFIATGDIRTMRRTLEFLRRAGYF
jgi:TonB family protein